MQSRALKPESTQDRAQAFKQLLARAVGQPSARRFRVCGH
jgi:hypothetical protein